MNILFIALALFALPLSAAASTPFFIGGDRVLVATSTPANVYAGGGTVTVTTPVKGDLTVIGGSLAIDASVAGDALLVGGSLQLAAPTAGDARFFGGSISITEPVGGDVVAVGGSVTATGGGEGSLFVIAGEVSILSGAGGSVTVYGNTVSLGGTYLGDVEVVATGRVTLLPGAVSGGAFNYQAPQEAIIHESAIIEGGVHYTGASYLPTAEEARAIAFASFGVFLFVKILGALILAGLFAGLFPSFADHVVTRTRNSSIRRVFLTGLLGFGVLVATPALFVLLALTFVGLGLALLLGLAYLLLVPLAFIYAAIICGAYLALFLFKREELRWSDAVFGMLVLYLVWSFPGIGWLLVSLLTMYTLGTLVLLAYRFAFPKENVSE